MANPSPSSPVTAAADGGTSPTRPDPVSTTNAAVTATSAPSANPARPYQPSPAPAPSQLQSQAQPPLLPLAAPFTSHSIPGRPPPTPPPPPHAILYPLARPANPVAGFAPPRGPSTRADQMFTVAAGNLGYARGSGSGVLAFPGPHQARAYGIANAGDHGAQSHAVAVVSIRPQPQVQSHGPSQPLFSGPRQAGTGANGPTLPAIPRTVHAGPQPKVTSASASFLSGDHNNYTTIREKARDDTVVMIHDRKVRLLDTSSTSLYALCRSWVRNGLPQVCQPTGEHSNVLPKPFPTATEVSECKKDDCENDLGKEESAGSVDELSSQDLLKGHIKKAKKIRAKLKEERLKRIDRYKQRLSMLLPLPTEPTRNNNPVIGS